MENELLKATENLQDVLKAFGKKDISKLTKKVITDKRGRRQTVWVKRGEEGDFLEREIPKSLPRSKEVNSSELSADEKAKFEEYFYSAINKHLPKKVVPFDDRKGKGEQYHAWGQPWKYGNSPNLTGNNLKEMADNYAKDVGQDLTHEFKTFGKDATALKAQSAVENLQNLLKAYGKKDISKLTKKVITDKRGRRQTVWVKRGEEPEKEGQKVKEREFHRFENNALYNVSEKDQKRLGLDPVERGRELNLSAEHYGIDPDTVSAEKQPEEGGKEKINWPFPAPDTKKRDTEALAEITKKFGADSWAVEAAKTAPDKATALAIFNDMERRKMPITADGYKKYLAEKAKEEGGKEKTKRADAWKENPEYVDALSDYKAHTRAHQELLVSAREGMAGTDEEHKKRMAAIHESHQKSNELWDRVEAVKKKHGIPGRAGDHVYEYLPPKGTNKAQSLEPWQLNLLKADAR